MIDAAPKAVVERMALSVMPLVAAGGSKDEDSVVLPQGVAVANATRDQGAARDLHQSLERVLLRDLIGANSSEKINSVQDQLEAIRQIFEVQVGKRGGGLSAASRDSCGH
jgi:hypothetical protein